MKTITTQAKENNKQTTDRLQLLDVLAAFVGADLDLKNGEPQPKCTREKRRESGTNVGLLPPN